MKYIRLMIIPVLLTFVIACDSNRQKATLGNSVDTGNTREGQHTDIDTTAKKADSTAKGNADPSGSIPKSNK